MPVSTKCLQLAGFIGFVVSAGCTSTATHNSTALSPSLAPEVASVALPESLSLAAVPREMAAADETIIGTVFSEVAYAPAPTNAASLVAASEVLTKDGASVTETEAVASLPAGQGEEIAIAALVVEDGSAAQEQGAVSSSKQARLDGTSVRYISAPTQPVLGEKASVQARSPELDALIARYAEHYEVPVSLVRRVVKRESTFNPAARNGPYYGLMQISHNTAKGLGYQGSPSGLLDAETNLTYAVKYLRGAYLTAGGNHDQAVRFYARGYYYDAKKRGLLAETGLQKNKRSRIAPAAPAIERPELPESLPTPALTEARFERPVLPTTLPAPIQASSMGSSKAGRVASITLPGVNAQSNRF